MSTYEIISVYEELKSNFKQREYYPTKFICRSCDTVVQYGDTSCPKCDRMLVWCECRIRQRNNKTSFEVLVQEKEMDYICDDCGKECNVLVDGVCGQCWQQTPNPEIREFPTLSGTWFLSTTISGQEKKNGKSSSR